VRDHLGTGEHLVRVDLAVPAYAHPAADPGLWERLAAAAAHLRFVVVNVHDGPGETLDPAYPPVLERLRAARVRMVGYVDTAYGGRPVTDVVLQARTWVTRYGLQGVFLDQVAGDFDHLGYYSAVALGARAAGAQFVVLNPGAGCHRGYADIANVTVTFEGSWQDYAGYRPRDWELALPATRFCHLVHHVPPEGLPEGPARAAAAHAGTAMFSSGTGGNPWDRLPEELVHAVRSCHPGAVTAAAVVHPAWQGRRYAMLRNADDMPGRSDREGPSPLRHGRSQTRRRGLFGLRRNRGGAGLAVPETASGDAERVFPEPPPTAVPTVVTEPAPPLP
jgi:hypothetical protein